MGSNREVVHTLKENSYFGEIALLVQMPRLATVRAATYVLLSMITRERFLPIIAEFPEQRVKITRKVQAYTLANTDDEDSDEEDEDTANPAEPGDRPSGASCRSMDSDISRASWDEGENSTTSQGYLAPSVKVLAQSGASLQSSGEASTRSSLAYPSVPQ